MSGLRKPGTQRERPAAGLLGSQVPELSRGTNGGCRRSGLVVLVVVVVVSSRRRRQARNMWQVCVVRGDVCMIQLTQNFRRKIRILSADCSPFSGLVAAEKEPLWLRNLRHGEPESSQNVGRRGTS